MTPEDEDESVWTETLEPGQRVWTTSHPIGASFVPLGRGVVVPRPSGYVGTGVVLDGYDAPYWYSLDQLRSCVLTGPDGMGVMGG